MYPGIIKLFIRTAVRVLALIVAYSIAFYKDIDLFTLLQSVEITAPYVMIFGVAGLTFDLTTRSWRKSWRFTSLQDVLNLVRGSTLIALALITAAFVFDRGAALPRSALVLTWLLDIGFFGGLLMSRRAFHENTLAGLFAPFLTKAGHEQVPLLLMGSLNDSDAFLRELNREPQPKYRAVGLVAPHVSDLRREVRGVPVVAASKDARRILEDFAKGDGERAVLFLEGAPLLADFDAEILARLRSRNVRLLRLNRVTDLDAHLGPPTLRELDLNELLARPPVHLDRERIRQLIAGKRVLVTGAGGSIGSEICRQVAALSCAHLTMIDQSEYGLFKVDQEIAASFPALSRSALLCDVRDRRRLGDFVGAEAPEIVFHAAALKHVPLMETHPSDSVLTNVIGTANIADAAIAASARTFVFISTDKAVDPPNVMGATKRLAERVVCQRRHAGGPRFNVVRFGNVLGSAGSVVPTFLDQIARGGPVTLTHPDIERYFMTIPEAVQLVLHATAKSTFDDVEGVLVLDMGKPVKIANLARRLIELHGKTPDVDIEIRITGLRPGEKMTEALFDVTERARQCDPGVFEVIDRNSDVWLTDAQIRCLEEVARRGDDRAVRDLLFEILPQLRLPREGVAVRSFRRGINTVARP